MKNVVIAEALRTAVGNMGGTLKPLSAEDLATEVLKGILNKSGIAPTEIDQVILGQCRQSQNDPALGSKARDR